MDIKQLFLTEILGQCHASTGTLVTCIKTFYIIHEIIFYAIWEEVQWQY